MREMERKSRLKNFFLLVSLAEDPGMFDDVLERDAETGILDEEFIDEVAGAGGDEVGKVDVNAGDAFKGGFFAGSVEGWFADEEFVAEDTERPQINLFVVALNFDHLGREVVEGPAERFATERRSVDGPSKIRNFQLAVEP